MNGGRIPTLGYATRTEAVSELARQGLAVTEIAERVGTSMQTVRVLVRRTRTALTLTTAPVSHETRALLHREAKRRGLHRGELAARLLEACADPYMIRILLVEDDD